MKGSTSCVPFLDLRFFCTFGDVSCPPSGLNLRMRATLVDSPTIPISAEAPNGSSEAGCIHQLQGGPPMGLKRFQFSASRCFLSHPPGAANWAFVVEIIAGFKVFPRELPPQPLRYFQSEPGCRSRTAPMRNLSCLATIVKEDI